MELTARSFWTAEPTGRLRQTVDIAGSDQWERGRRPLGAGSPRRVGRLTRVSAVSERQSGDNRSAEKCRYGSGTRSSLDPATHHAPRQPAGPSWLISHSIAISRASGSGATPPKDRSRHGP